MGERSVKDLTIDGETGQYMRSTHPAYVECCEKVASLYGDNKTSTFMFTSGTHATKAAIRAAIRKVSANRKMFTIGFASEMYCGTLTNIMPSIEKEYNIICFTLDVWDPEAMKTFYKNHHDKNGNPMFKKCAILVVESMSNPNGFIPLWNKIPKDICLVVDNTWCSPAVFNPFESTNASAVVDSGTKYLSGGTRISGFVTTRESSIRKHISRIVKDDGIHIAHEICCDVAYMVDGLEERINISSAATIKTIEFLRENPNVELVTCTELPFGNGKIPSIIYGWVKTQTGTKKHWEEWCKDLSIYPFTSYGKKYDIVNKFTGYTRRKGYIAFRLSLGYEENPKRFEDLSILIERIVST